MSDIGRIDETRERLGPVGVWWAAIGTRPADTERAVIAEIEELGFPAFWIGEGPTNKEAFAHAGLLLAATTDLVIGTGIANIYARDATAMKSGGNALAEAHPGRFVLGIGVSHATSVQARGQDYGKPLTTMRNYLDAMDAANYLPPAPPLGLPRVLAALRPKMLELARDRTDGAHPYLTTPRHTEAARLVLGDAPLLIPEQGAVLETDPEKARAIAREHLKYYATLPNYLNSWRAEGFEDADFADGLSDRLVDALVAWGDADAIAARVIEHLDAGADHVCVQAVNPDFDRALADLRELAPTLTSISARR